MKGKTRTVRDQPVWALICYACSREVEIEARGTRATVRCPHCGATLNVQWR